jgi:hypothetical protein
VSLADLLSLVAAPARIGTLLVSGNGAIFKSKQAMQIYDALEIRKEQIHQQQS